MFECQCQTGEINRCTKHKDDRQHTYVHMYIHTYMQKGGKFKIRIADLYSYTHTHTKVAIKVETESRKIKFDA